MGIFRLIHKSILFFTLCFFYLLPNLYAIDSLKILPENPTNEDIVYVVCFTTVPSCWVTVEPYKVTVNADEIKVDATYYLNGSNCDNYKSYTDTIKLGKLGEGSYKLKAYNNVLGGYKDYSNTSNNEIEFHVRSILNGFNMIDNVPKLSVYPNPCQEFVFVDLGSITDRREVTIQIIDICGQVVYNKEYEEDHPQDIRLKVMLTEIPRGIYFVKANYGNKEITQKIIVK